MFLSVVIYQHFKICIHITLYSIQGLKKAQLGIYGIGFMNLLWFVWLVKLFRQKWELTNVILDKFNFE